MSNSFTEDFLAVLAHFLPEGINRLPSSLKLTIIGFVIVHVCGLLVFGTLGLLNYSRKGADFKTKLI